MNAKLLFWQALHHFKKRNATILPQMQLQTGANERWLMREFALAMNRHFAGTWAPRRMTPYADCEVSYADISVWDGDDDDPAAAYEGKVLYPRQSRVLVEGIVKKAWRQLDKSPLAARRKVGLFFVVYWKKGPKAKANTRAMKAFRDRVRDAVRTKFRTDHNIRLTEVSPLTEIQYLGTTGYHPYHTASWVTWGTPHGR